MRLEDERIADIVVATQSILRRCDPLTLAAFAASEDLVKAAFYDVIVIGEAIRDLVARRDALGNAVADDAAIVRAHPEIPWLDWIGMRDRVTHQYFRAAPELLWRDYQDGAVARLLNCCQAWLEQGV